MSLTSIPVVNFAGGEASPAIKGRVDVKQYSALAETVENNLITQHGGSLRTSGTKHVQRTKTVSTATRLIPFIFSTGNAYVLEFGATYMRVFQNNGSIVETSLVITAATKADPCVVTTSTAHGYSNGDVIDISEVVGMTELNGKRYIAANITSNTLELQDEDAVNIDSSAFTTYSSAGITERVYQITTPYAAADLADVKFTQQADVMYLFHSSYPVQKLSRLASDSWTIAEIAWDASIHPPFLDINTSATTLTPSATTGVGITVTASTAIFSVLGHVGSYWRITHGATTGYCKFTAVASTTSATATVIVDFGATTASADWYEGAWSIYQGYPADGKLYEQRLLTVGSNLKPLNVWGSAFGDFENLAVPEITATATDEDAISYTIGSNQVDKILWLYPTGVANLGTAGGIFLLSSGSDALPITPTNVSVKHQNENGAASVSPVRIGQSIYYIERSGEVLGEYKYSLEYDAFESVDMTYLSDHILNSGVTDMAVQYYPFKVLWCVRGDGQMATFTRQEENAVKGWARQVFTGTDAAVENVCVIPNGSEDQVWVVVKRTINGSVVRYVEYFMPYEFDDKQDAFFVQSGLTKDVPITITGATAANPVVITAAGHGLSDGDKVHITDVVGMTELNHDYYFVNTATSTTFELQNSSSVDIDGTAFTAYISGGEIRLCSTSITGLDHLEGETVDILADGTVLPSEVVTGGAITLDFSSGMVHVGLGYTSTLKTMNLEQGSKTGTAQGKVGSFSRVYVRFLESLGAKVGDGVTQDIIPFGIWGDQLDESPPLFTGDKKVEFPSGHRIAKHVVVTQDQPLPMHILGIFPELLVSD